MILRRSYFVILTIAIIGFSFSIDSAFGESESFTVSARNYYDYQIFMNAGDEISFAITVNGGANDDIYFTLYSPTSSKLTDGVIDDQFSDNFSAVDSGTYTFRFDNTGSTISNKSISFSYQIQTNTYYIYVDKIPDWTSYAGSSVYDSTQAWKDANPKLNFYQAKSPEEATLRIQWVKEFGVEHVGYAYGSHFIEVGLGDSYCNGNWRPFSADHVNWIMTHEIGHVIGLEHSSDPSSIMYPTAPRAQYGLIEEPYTISKGYLQFIPFCASKDITSFYYGVSSDDPTYGFDVYVVPSINEYNKAAKGESFAYYSSSECYGENYLSYSRTCSGISQESGLLISIDNRQTNGLTKLTVKQLEINESVNSLHSTSSTTLSYEYPDEYTENQQTLNDALSQTQESRDKYLQSEGEKQALESKISQAEAEKRSLESKISQAEAEKRSLESKISQAEADASTKIDATATAYEKKSVNRNLIDVFDAEISSVVNSLTGITYENQQAQKKIEQAWEEKGIAESEQRKAEKIWMLGERSLTNKDESKAITYFDGIQSIIESGREHLNSSVLLLDGAKNIVMNQKPKITCGEGTIEKDGVCAIAITDKPKSNGGGCLIATATYGSELAPQVQQLRELRDNSLLQTASGTSFMNSFNNFYYSFSPTIADWERESPAFKEFVKISLTPMISSLSILNYVDMDSEDSVLGYGISLILLNIGMYFVAPAIVIVGIKKKIEMKLKL
jgi:hypothetical protein